MDTNNAPDEVTGDLPDTSAYWLLRTILRVIIEQRGGTIFIPDEELKKVQASEEPFSFSIIPVNAMYQELSLVKGE